MLYNAVKFSIKNVFVEGSLPSYGKVSIMKPEKRWLPNISARGERARRVAKRFCGRL